MSKGAINFSSDNEYYTPKSLVERFGDFDYDPATTKEKAEEFGIKNYDTIDTNGLTSDWSDYNKIWINPPFTLKNEFFKKAVDSYRKREKEIYLLLPISYLTTKSFHVILGKLGGTIYLPNGRLKFESGLGKELKSPAFGSVIFKIGKGKIKVEKITT